VLGATPPHVGRSYAIVGTCNFEAVAMNQLRVVVFILSLSSPKVCMFLVSVE